MGRTSYEAALLPPQEASELRRELGMEIAGEVCVDCVGDLIVRDTAHVATRGNFRVMMSVSHTPGASTPTRLRLVLRNRGGFALGLLQHGLNLWPSQKARTQRLILDALCQPPDDPGSLRPRRVRLCRLAPCLIHRCQCRLDLPLFCWPHSPPDCVPRSVASPAASRNWPMACSRCPSHAASKALDCR